MHRTQTECEYNESCVVHQDKHLPKFDLFSIIHWIAMEKSMFRVHVKYPTHVDRVVQNINDLSHGSMQITACIPPPIVNGSTYRPLALALCVYFPPSLLVTIGSGLPRDRPMFAFALCFGEVPVVLNQSSWCKVESDQRCQRLPAVVQHHPLVTDQSYLESLGKIESFSPFLLP